MNFDRPHVYAPLLFLVFFAVLLAREYTMVRDEALADATIHASEMTGLLVSEIGGEAALEEMVRDPSDPAKASVLNSTVRSHLRIFHFFALNIYDKTGKIIYSSREPLRGVKTDGDKDVRHALAGERYANFISPEEYAKEYGQRVDRDLVEVYAPLKTHQGTFVFETYFDYTEFLERGMGRLWSSAASLAGVLALTIGLLAFVRERLRKIEQKVADLRLMTICSYCKNVKVSTKDEPEEWQRIERYLGFRENIDFSHGICPECCSRHFPDIAEELKRRGNG